MSTSTVTPNAKAAPPRTLPGLLGWTRASYVLMSLFAVLVFIIIVVWWPLAVDYLATADPRYPLWLQLDWLLLGVFAAMSLLIMARPDLKADALIVLIGFAGGLVIESWGTQTNLWRYYTHERPPLWIIPAWPIASLAIDRLFRALGRLFPAAEARRPGAYQGLYWLIFLTFYALMLAFVWPTMEKSLTLAALVLCAVLIATPTDYRAATLTFLAGAGLGYFLELWGTTRACWTYYTLETPPLFAVLAHGMAAVAFWRVNLLWRCLVRPEGLVGRRLRRPVAPEAAEG
ncbi:MAG: hypothetical protein IT317_20020 [Anaerolineales bacterium]|nr:hypothetical protein [Anaerolineales bacterium]